MNFVENNGKKVAAILCVASAFPVVATVVAAKEEPGWHGDRYVNEDKTVAKGWQEIEGKSYYFSEDGTVNSSKTEEATTASVSSNITGEVKETVATASQEAVKEETEEKAAEVVETVAETPVTTTEATDTTETPAEAPAETPAETPVVTPTETAPVETPAAPEETAPVETPATPEVTTPEVQAPAETPAAPEVTTPEVQAPAETAPVETPAAPEETAPVETPATPEETTPVETPAATTLGQRISSEAQKLVGVTDGLWCTQVVQQALANAGVSDAYQLWPDQYAGQYGYYTNDPQEGDLLYYNNGGRGVDHIAIYIGNGQAVHGNYEGKTVIASAYLSTAASPQFIRVVR